MARSRISDDELIEAWKTSWSLRQVLVSLNLAPQGGNYKTLRNRSLKLGLTEDDFIQRPQKPAKEAVKLLVLNPLEGEKGVTNSKILMRRLIDLGILPEACCRCGITEYKGTPAPLELEHIDGDHFNNSLDNLTILCINCHSQTETYVGKNNRSSNDMRI